MRDTILNSKRSDHPLRPPRSQLSIVSPEISFLSLGSNVGDRRKKILKAIKAIGQWPKTELLKKSSILETEPWGYSRQRKFLNCVVKIQTRLSPMALLLWAKITEIKLGRRPRFRWGPREIDIDILFYGRKKIKTPFLTIPHPRLRQRDFAVEGLRALGARLG